MKEKMIKIYRNLRIILWIILNRKFYAPCSRRKMIKEARYELGYDDIGEWF